MKRDKNLVWRRVDAAGLDLKGLKVAVVGGTGGLGRAISHLLASRGASVTVVGQTFRDSGVPGIEFLQEDLSLMSEAQRVAAALPAETLDLVVLTTGIFAAPTRQETAEGLERDMAVSYLSRLVLVRGMAPRLGKHRSAAPMKPRVFIMGYPGTGQAGSLGDLNAEKSYSGMAVHMNTVAGNEMLVIDSAKRYANASFFGLNPGLIKTNIRSNFLGEGSLRFRFIEWMIGLLAPSAETYAETVTPLLVSPDLEGHSGAMFDKKGDAILPSAKLTDDHVRAFLADSEALVARANVRVSNH
ncbi:SDR family NAD(P)-dependent oxidoreductase [Hyalangium rubrum]|uniref:SDR family NAD(P)-dependent oxidoreductase n=1 Tax=Hyalangium rubrum TaxID=3103134 RepID=A0ABU5H816_9BACT|nr:SDR family NAD(P)-dependent oxidoreductase [Hyalangium sp. s54d21]MDY7229593.1 SDR family NAD(P)-dependent oxidoreductase [Hyalangium sp. s54d21]